MAILAAYPVVAQPPREVEVDSFIDSRWLEFRSLNGQSLIPFTGREFIAAWGMTGMDVPPVEVVEGFVPGEDGSFIDDVRVGSRKVGLPIYVASDSSHLGFLQNKAAIRAMLNHRGHDWRKNDGTFDLVAHSALGERSLRCMYLDGMGGEWSQDSTGSWWESFGLQLLNARTYWYGERWSTPPLRLPVPTESFFGAFPPQLSPSAALGSPFSIDIPGDAPTWARVDAVGPCASLLVTAPGLNVSVPAGLAAGEEMTLITSPRGRTALFSGVKQWSRIGADTRYDKLTPGDAKVTISMPEATSASSASVSGDSLYLSPW